MTQTSLTCFFPRRNGSCGGSQALDSAEAQALRASRVRAGICARLQTVRDQVQAERGESDRVTAIRNAMALHPKGSLEHWVCIALLHGPRVGTSRLQGSPHTVWLCSLVGSMISAYGYGIGFCALVIGYHIPAGLHGKGEQLIRSLPDSIAFERELEGCKESWDIVDADPQENREGLSFGAPSRMGRASRSELVLGFKELRGRVAGPGAEQNVRSATGTVSEKLL